MKEVKCINLKIEDNQKHNPNNDSLKQLEVGKVYEVEKYIYCSWGWVDGVILKDVKSSHSSGGFKMNRFIEINK